MKRALLTAGTTALLVLIADQLTKFLVVRNLALYEDIPVIPGFFNLTYIHNTGIAFGLFQGRPMFFLWVSLFCILLISWYFILEVRRSHQKVSVFGLIGWGAVVGGAVGNVWDRLFNEGRVIDFLDFYLGNNHWPAFNIADSAICVGIALIILFLPKQEEAAAKDTEPAPDAREPETR